MFWPTGTSAHDLHSLSTNINSKLGISHRPDNHTLVENISGRKAHIFNIYITEHKMNVPCK